jgi:hypothetical protein
MDSKVVAQLLPICQVTTSGEQGKNLSKLTQQLKEILFTKQ